MAPRALVRLRLFLGTPPASSVGHCTGILPVLNRISSALLALLLDIVAHRLVLYRHGHKVGDEAELARHVPWDQKAKSRTS